MIYFLALLPATMLTIAGYAVMYLAQRSEGGLRSFGKYLGFWAFTLAGLVILGSIVAAARGRNMHAMMMHGDCGGDMQCPYMHSWRQPPPGGAPHMLPGAPSPPGPPPTEAAPPK